MQYELLQFLQQLSWTRCDKTSYGCATLDIWSDDIKLSCISIFILKIEFFVVAELSDSKGDMFEKFSKSFWIEIDTEFSF